MSGVPELEFCEEDCNPSQWKLLCSRDSNVLMAGGFGSGKTSALALKILQLIAENWGYPGLIVAPNWRTMWSTTYRRLMATIKECLPKELWPALVDKQKECYLDFGGGTHVFLRSAKNYDGYDGLDVAWAAGDEARYWSLMAWSVLQGRVRVPAPLNQTVLASTPAMGWLSDEFDNELPDRRLIVAPTRENIANLREGYIDDLKLSYSPRLWRALVEGEFTILEGAVYEDFDSSSRSPWIIDYEPTVDVLADQRCYLMVDPGYRRSAWAWGVQTGYASWLVYDEFAGENMTDQACVAEVNRRGWPIDEIWVDPAAKATQSYEGANTLKAMRGIRVRGKRPFRMLKAANREIAFGVDKTRVLLGNGDKYQPRRLRFAKRLLDIERGKKRGIVKDLAAYRYPEDKDGRAISDIPLKDGVTDHYCDAVRYFAVGMHATNAELRRLDQTSSAAHRAGIKIAA